MAIRLSVDQALPKIRHYCSYQERCHQEVKEKLYGYGLRKNDVDLVISQLIEEDYLNEERFARQFAGGKFRMKSWGRVRIQNELKQRQISDYCIRKAMKEIVDDEYLSALDKLATGRWDALKRRPYSSAGSKKPWTTYYIKDMNGNWSGRSCSN
jgi:regulatory protein